MEKLFSDEFFMREALKQAVMAREQDEVPVGAVIASDKRIIAKAHNLVETLQDVTAHAEMQAMTSAFNFLQSKYLNDCTLYVTLEPCLMCAGAIFWAQLGRLVYGADDEKAGYTRITPHFLQPKLVVEKGVLKEDCGQILKDFFKGKR